MTIIEAPSPEVPAQCVIDMPLGLLGFEQYKRFVLHADPAEEPFLWLQVLDAPKLAFLVVSPHVVLPDYRPQIPSEDAGFLRAEAADTLFLNIVTVRGSQEATVNLKGPIVLNRRTLVAKQVIPLNAPEYSVTHPLPVQGN